MVLRLSGQYYENNHINYTSFILGTLIETRFFEQ